MRLLVTLVALLFSGLASAGNLSLVVVTGMGGTEAYTERFNDLAERLQVAARQAGLPAERVYRLAAESDNPDHLPADKQQLTRTLNGLAASLANDDQLLLVLVGHGTPRDNTSLFNLPGPDIDPFELAGLLEQFGERRVAVVNAASSSGPFLRTLSGDNRIIITATSGGQEFHAVEFPQFFVEAFEQQRADRNKDQRVSLLEAFNYARLEVRRSFDNEERLLTEHALLDDNGDGEGSLEADEFSADGALAAGLHLEQPEQLLANMTPTLVALLDEKRAREEAILDLKRRKQAMQDEDYYRQLETLLIELARIAQRLREEEST